MKQIKNEKFSDNPSFLGYKVNTSFLTENLPYSQICGTKCTFHIIKFVVQKDTFQSSRRPIFYRNFYNSAWVWVGCDCISILVGVL